MGKTRTLRLRVKIFVAYYQLRGKYLATKKLIRKKLKKNKD